MPRPIPRSLPRWLLPMILPLAVLAAFGIASFLHQLSLPAGEPQPIQRGPFGISASYLPESYSEPLLVQGAMNGTLGLFCQETSGRQLLPGLLSFERKHGSVRMTALPFGRNLSSSPKPGLLTTDGRLLQIKSGQQRSSATEGTRQMLAQLQGASAQNGEVAAEYTFDVPQYRGRLQWALLDDGSLAAVGRRPDSYGVVRLQLCKPGEAAETVQELRAVVCAFPVSLEQGQSIAVLTKPGRLFILDRQTQRLEARPELDLLAQCIFSGGMQLHSVALAENFAVASFASSSGLKIWDRQGLWYDLQQRDPERERPDGSSRIVPLNLLTAGARGGKWERFAGQLAREGRSAAVNVVTETPQLAALAPDCVAVVDRHYNRVLLIEYKPELLPEQSRLEAAP